MSDAVTEPMIGPAILRCPECGVSWMHGEPAKHMMTCSGGTAADLSMPTIPWKAVHAFVVALRRIMDQGTCEIDFETDSVVLRQGTGRVVLRRGEVQAAIAAAMKAAV